MSSFSSTLKSTISRNIRSQPCNPVTTGMTSRQYVSFSFPKKNRKEAESAEKAAAREEENQKLTFAKTRQIRDLKKRLKKISLKGAPRSQRATANLKLMENPFAVKDSDYELPPLPKKMKYFDPETDIQLSHEQILQKREARLRFLLRVRDKQPATPLMDGPFVPMTSTEQKWFQIYVQRRISSSQHLELLRGVQQEKDLAIKQEQLKVTAEGVRNGDRRIVPSLPQEKEALKKLQEDFAYVHENLSYLSADLQQEFLKYNPEDSKSVAPKGGVFVSRILSRYTADVYKAFKSAMIPKDRLEEFLSFYKTKEEEIAKDAVINAQKENFHKLMKDLIMWRTERRKHFVRAIVRECDDMDLARRIKTCFMNWKLWKKFVQTQLSKEGAIREKFIKFNEAAWKKDLDTRVEWQMQHEKEFRELIQQWKMIQRNENMTGKEIFKQLEKEDSPEDDPHRYELFSKYFYEGDHGWVEKRLFAQKRVDMPDIDSIDPLNYQQSRFELSKQFGIENAPFLQQQRQLMQLASGDAPFGADSVSGTFKPPVANPDLPPVELPPDHDPIVASEDRERTLIHIGRQLPFTRLKENPLIKHQYDFPFEETRLSWKRVSIQRSKGKEVNHNCHLLIGSERGFVGVGFGRSSDPRKAVDKARRDAFANLRSFDVDTENPRTMVTSRIRSKHRSSILVMTPSRYEFVAAHPVLRKICRYLGITHCSIKLYGSRHMYSVLPNFFKALEMLKTEEFARAGRGKSGPQKRERYFSNYLERAHDRSVYGKNHLNTLQ